MVFIKPVSPDLLGKFHIIYSLYRPVNGVIQTYPDFRFPVACVVNLVVPVGTLDFSEQIYFLTTAA